MTFINYCGKKELPEKEILRVLTRGNKKRHYSGQFYGGQWWEKKAIGLQKSARHHFDAI